MKYVLSLPKGKAEDLSKIKEEAIRELKEETGLFCDAENLLIKENLLPVVYVDAYKSTEKEKWFAVNIQPDEKNSSNSEQILEHGEIIKVVLIPIDKNIYEAIFQIVNENNYGIDKCLHMLLQGIKCGLV